MLWMPIWFVLLIIRSEACAERPAALLLRNQGEARFNNSEPRFVFNRFAPPRGGRRVM